MLPRACIFTFVALAVSACFYDPKVAASSEGATSDATSEPAVPTTTSVTTTCGDGALELGEQCDDGNLESGDGCEDDCTTTPGEKCGDGNQDDGEDCDDGNNVDGDGCGGNCRFPAGTECGDGELHPGEQCDDGNTMSGDGCESNCTTTPQCGDGLQGPGELCDDGNEDDSDACLGSCIPADCGDGVVWLGMELCDDGRENGTYARCNADCSGLGESCGDGARNGPEECDDANQVDNDDCTNDCIAPRLVFVTAAGFTGNLGGVAGADAKCAQAAAVALLPEDLSWIAWISDSTKSPASANRMETDYTGYYKLTDGSALAHGWADLSSPPLALSISVDEDGLPAIDPLQAWSNTLPAGISAGSSHCENWTSAKFSTTGRYGDVTATDSGWSDSFSGNPAGCSNALHLYCFQNAPPP